MQPTERSLENRAALVRLSVAALTVLAALAAAHVGLQGFALQTGYLHIEKVTHWTIWRDQYRARVLAEPERYVALLGDSVMMNGNAELEDGAPIPRQLENALASLAKEGPITVAPLVWPGQTTLERYFIADEMLASGVRKIVIALNLGSLAPQWVNAWTSLDLAGLLPGARIPRALALPLSEVGIGLDQVVLYRVLGSPVLAGPWRVLRLDQARVNQFLERTQQDLRIRPEARKPLQEALFYSQVAGASDRTYSAAFSGLDRDGVGMRLLEASLRVYREGGARVAIFVDPIDLELLEERGVLSDRDRDGLRQTLATLADIAEENGAAFIDLHEILPHEGFHDRMGHLAFRPPVNGNRRVAEALAPQVYRALFENP